jgi:exopolyphosphatase/guanosine-5'-triphosphate,3'-diphosphate pyrophosphatase
MAATRRRTLTPRKSTLTVAAPPVVEPPRPVAVIDIGASAIRLLVAEAAEGREVLVLEDLSRGVLLGKDTFTSGRLGAASIEATLKALEGFRRVIEGCGVVHYRAVATSAVREAQNRDTFLDRVRLRTGIDVEVIDGSEENRLTYVAVRECLRGHEALTSADALLVEVGGGSADISYLRNGEPIRSGTYPLGSIRMRQNLHSWRGTHEQRMRLLKRHIHNVVGDIKRESQLLQAKHFIALGGDMRFAAAQLLGTDVGPTGVCEVPRDALLELCARLETEEVDQLAERYQLPIPAAETLVPALIAYRELLAETAAQSVLVPAASLRLGLLLDIARRDESHGIEDFGKQVLASAAALGEKYRYDVAHGRHVALLAVRLYDELKSEHGLGARERLLLEVAALLHDIGNYVSLRSHHKHTQYILSVSEVFGLSRDDMALVSHIARYHRRALPEKSHSAFMALDRDSRVVVNKLAAILRLANALDADHMQKVKDVKLRFEDGVFVIEVEGAGDMTIERLTAQSRCDLMSDVFGRRVSLQEIGARA